MKKILSIILLFAIIYPIWVFSASYRDAEKVSRYIDIIEQKAAENIAQRSLLEKVDLLVKIQKIINSYEAQTSKNTSKLNYVNFLYALEEYIAGTMTGEYRAPIILTITVIDDVRCSNCDVESIVSQLTWLEYLSNAEFVRKDFSDEGVSQYLKQRNIQSLPAIIFSSNDIDDGGQIAPYLSPTNSGDYSLNVWANFDPFTLRSEKWFEIIEMSVVDELMRDAYVLWAKDAEILWLEYSDLECPFCARLHNEWTVSQVLENYSSKVKFSFQHFPLDFHPNARDAANATQCVGNLYWDESYYKMIEVSFENMWNNNFSMSEYYELLDDTFWNVDITKVQECAKKQEIIDQVDQDRNQWQDIFWVTGTPWNVLINIQTGEYATLPWAYPYSNFQQLIDRLLK